MEVTNKRFQQQLWVKATPSFTHQQLNIQRNFVYHLCIFFLVSILFPAVTQQRGGIALPRAERSLVRTTLPIPVMASLPNSLVFFDINFGL